MNYQDASLFTLITAYISGGFEDNVTLKEITVLLYFIKHAEAHKIMSLIDGFETPFGLELLYITHKLLSNQNMSVVDIKNKGSKMVGRQNAFTGYQIEKAIEALTQHGLL